MVQRHMSRLGRESLYVKIESATDSSERSALELVLQDYGEPACQSELMAMLVVWSASQSVALSCQHGSYCY